MNKFKIEIWTSCAIKTTWLHFFYPLLASNWNKQTKKRAFWKLLHKFTSIHLHKCLSKWTLNAEMQKENWHSYEGFSRWALLRRCPCAYHIFRYEEWHVALMLPIFQTGIAPTAAPSQLRLIFLRQGQLDWLPLTAYQRGNGRRWTSEAKGSYWSWQTSCSWIWCAESHSQDLYVGSCFFVLESYRDAMCVDTHHLQLLCNSSNVVESWGSWPHTGTEGMHSCRFYMCLCASFFGIKQTLFTMWFTGPSMSGWLN